jgi:hypothetical protein
MAQRFALAAPPVSGKVSRKEAVTRTGRATSIDQGAGSQTFSPAAAQQLAQQARANSIAEEDDNPFSSSLRTAKPAPAAVAPADPFSAANANADLFSFFDPLAAPAPVQQQRSPAAKPAPQPARAVPAADPFSASFDSQLSFGNGGGAAVDPFDPFAAAVIPAAVAPVAAASGKAPTAAAAKKSADESSDDSDSSSSDSSDSSDSDSSDSDSDVEEDRKRKKAAQKAASLRAKEVAIGGGQSSRYATPAASHVAHTPGNKALGVPGAGSAATAASSTGTKAGGTSSLTVDVLDVMHKGTPFLKYGKSGFPHFRQFQLSADNSRIEWFSGNKKTSETQIPLAVIDEIRLGQNTANFSRHPAPDLAKSSFSVLYNMGRSTLDVIAKDPNDFLIWTRGLRELVRISSEGRPGELEELKTLPLNLGIQTARRSSVDIRDVNTGASAASQAPVEADEPPRARAMQTGNKGMMKEVQQALSTLKHKLSKRRDEMREHHLYMSVVFPSRARSSAVFAQNRCRCRGVGACR